MRPKKQHYILVAILATAAASYSCDDDLGACYTCEQKEKQCTENLHHLDDIKGDSDGSKIGDCAAQVKKAYEKKGGLTLTQSPLCNLLYFRM